MKNLYYSIPTKNDEFLFQMGEWVNSFTGIIFFRVCNPGVKGDLFNKDDGHMEDILDYFFLSFRSPLKQC